MRCQAKTPKLFDCKRVIFFGRLCIWGGFPEMEYANKLIFKSVSVIALAIRYTGSAGILHKTTDLLSIMKILFRLFSMLVMASGLAIASDDVTYFEIATTFENNTTPTTDFGVGDHVVTGSTEIEWLLSSFTEAEALKTGVWGSNEKNLIAPNDVGKDVSDWMLTFVNKVDVKEEFQITAISFTYIVATTEGGYITDGILRDVQWSVAIAGLDGSTLLKKTVSETITISSGWKTVKSVAFELSEEEYAVINGDYVVTIWAENPNMSVYDKNTDFLNWALASQEEPSAAYGLKTISFMAETTGNPVETVPEPATATLSLLALAGLVARRRRR